MCFSIHVALAVLAIVTTSGQIVETLSDVEVIISVNICTRSGSFGRRTIPKAFAVSVIPISAFRLFVIAIMVMEHSAHMLARVRGICGGSIGETLPVNAVSAAVVLVVVTNCSHNDLQCCGTCCRLNRQNDWRNIDCCLPCASHSMT